jgi:endonuclease/exonuclease/phosphatase family metal-dependent hydrolase
MSRQSLALASLNIAGPLRPSRLLPFDLRTTEICRFLETSSLDVVLLQEVWRPSQLAAMRRRLPSYPFAGWERGVAGQLAGGLVTLSRIPLSTTRYTGFRRARVLTGGLAFRVEQRARGALQGVLTSRLPTVGAVVGNVHLVSNRDGDWSPGNRCEPVQREQLALMHAALAGEPDGLAIVGGDFNLASDGSLYSRITDDGRWRDPFVDNLGRTSPVTTFRREYLPPDATAHRIDYLLVAGHPRHAIVDHGLLFEDPVRFPDGRISHVSDHLGLHCRVALS